MNLSDLLKAAEVSIPLGKVKKMEDFVSVFVDKNQMINLTKINTLDEFLIKHILDSVLVNSLVEINPKNKVADLGTGGGLPGVPLSILNSDSDFTLMDSVQKKIRCVNEFADQLGLKNIYGISDRLEVLGQNKKYREKFDLVFARALAPLNVLLELAIPFVHVGGRFVAMKGPGYSGELEKAKNAMGKLSLEVPQIKSYELPNGMGERHLLIFSKVKPTSFKYPRKVGVPKKNPL